MEKHFIKEQQAPTLARIIIAGFLLVVLMQDWLGIKKTNAELQMQVTIILEILVVFAIVTLFIRIPGMLGRLFMFLVDLAGFGAIFYLTHKQTQTHLLIYTMPLVFFAHAVKMERPDLITATILALCFGGIGLSQGVELTPVTIEIFALNFVVILCLAVIADFFNAAMMQMTTQNLLLRAHERIESQNQELERIRSKFDSETVFDPVTGLYNFRFFKKRLEEELSRASREGEELTLVMVGVDRFKRYNEIYTSEEGDRALKKVGDLLTRYVRDTDLVARYMDDLFFALLPNTPPRNSLYPALRIRDGIAKAKISPDGKFDVTVGLGTATFPDDTKDGAELINKAAKALKRSKEKGPNKATQFSAIKDGGRK